MPLPGAGSEIKFSQMRDEFNDTGPVSFSEFYRNGGLVPGSEIVDVWELQQTFGPYNLDSDDHLAIYSNDTAYVRISGAIFDSFTVDDTYGGGETGDPPPGPNPPEGTDYGYTWGFPQLTQSSPYPPNAPDQAALVWWTIYSVEEFGYTSTPVELNLDVPESGTISLSDMAGATGTIAVP